LLFNSGGDRETIEQYVLALFAECSCKDTKSFTIPNAFNKKV